MFYPLNYGETLQSGQVFSSTYEIIADTFTKNGSRLPGIGTMLASSQ